MTVTEAAVGRVRARVKERNKATGNQAEREGEMRKGGRKRYRKKTGCGLRPLSVGEEAPTPFEYLSVGSTGRKWLCTRGSEIG